LEREQGFLGFGFVEGRERMKCRERDERRGGREKRIKGGI
jgi:hypothetical protein